MPNHVAILGDEVVVTRWDAPEKGDKFTLRSVNDRLEAFYTYLTKKRNSSRPDVVATLLNLFRAVRGEVASAGAPDDESVFEFLELLAALVDAEQVLGLRHRFDAIWQMARTRKTAPVLTSDSRNRLELTFKEQIASIFFLEFSAALAVRHAASAIFQEAHFTFQSSLQGDLFVHQPLSTINSVSRGTHHFTPPSLARSVVEQALAAVSD